MIWLASTRRQSLDYTFIYSPKVIAEIRGNYDTDNFYQIDVRKTENGKLIARTYPNVKPVVQTEDLLVLEVPYRRRAGDKDYVVIENRMTGAPLRQPEESLIGLIVPSGVEIFRVNLSDYEKVEGPFMPHLEGIQVKSPGPFHVSHGLLERACEQ